MSVTQISRRIQPQSTTKEGVVQDIQTYLSARSSYSEWINQEKTLLETKQAYMTEYMKLSEQEKMLSTKIRVIKKLLSYDPVLTAVDLKNLCDQALKKKDNQPSQQIYNRELAALNALLFIARNNGGVVNLENEDGIFKNELISTKQQGSEIVTKLNFNEKELIKIQLCLLGLNIMRTTIKNKLNTLTIEDLTTLLNTPTDPEIKNMIQHAIEMKPPLFEELKPRKNP